VAKEEHFWTLPSKQRMGGLFTTIQAPTLVRLRQKEGVKERKSGQCKRERKGGGRGEEERGGEQVILRGGVKRYFFCL